MSSIPVLIGIFGARSLVLCVVFCRYFFPFPFGHRITDVLLPLWYLLTFLYLTQHVRHEKKLRVGLNVLYINAAQPILYEDRILLTCG